MIGHPPKRSEPPRTVAELQDWLVSAICDPREPVTHGIVSDGPRMSGQAQLEIYRHAYSARLTECLRDDYPVLAATLGDETFTALCQRYIAAYPSCSPNLNAFGRQMAELCMRETRLLEASAFYADLARLEWALVEVTHAATPAALTSQALQAIPVDAWPSVRLVGTPALRLLTFEYPVNAHYKAYRSLATVLPLPAARACAVAVYRRELSLWRMDLSPTMARVLSALLSGAPIGQALSCLSASEFDASAQSEAARSVMTWFQTWMLSGFFSELTTD